MVAMSTHDPFASRDSFRTIIDKLTAIHVDLLNFAAVTEMSTSDRMHVLRGASDISSAIHNLKQAAKP